MKKFPVEMLKLIFSCLDPKDKLECMTVCRLWESIIERTCLLETVRLSRVEGLDSFINAVLLKEHLGTQVKNLVIDTFEEHCPFKLPMTLYHQLSNLKVLYLGHNAVRYLNNKMILEVCRNSIEHLVIVSNYMIPLMSAETHMYYNLKSLSINGDYLYYRSFFDLIMKSPNLSHLHLYSRWMEPSLIELIHSVLPKLTSIKFENMALLPNKAITDIVPNLLVTSFMCEFDDKSSPNNVNTWLKYITKKYPNLTEFTLRSRNFSRWSEKSILEHMSLLENYHQNLRMSLKKLCIHIIKMPLELNDKEGLTDDSIESISTILERNKRSLITSLTEIENKPTPIQFNPKRESLVQHYFGFTIPMITELTLNFKYKSKLGTLAFQRLITMCPPNLESLELEYVKLVYNREKEPRLESLNKLRLSNVELPGDSCVYLGIAFPNVKTLILEKCRSTDNILVMLDLDLFNLEVINDSLYPGNYLKVTTLSNLETQYYTISHPKSNHALLRKCSISGSIPLYPPTKTRSSVPEEVCFLNFMCASVRNVVVFP